MSIGRGTTPTHEFGLPETIDPTKFSVAYITYAQDGTNLVEKELSDMTITGNTIKVQLTQEETLLFTSRDKSSTLSNYGKTQGLVEIQLRYRNNDGFSDESEILLVEVDKILKDGVI